MIGIIADYIMARRHKLGQHILFIGSGARIPPNDLTVYQHLQELAEEQVGQSFPHLPVARRGPAALEEFARQVPEASQRCHLLRAKLAGTRPAEGHIQLAHLLHDGYFPTVFTMEPHNLLEQALHRQHLELKTDYHLLVAGIDEPQAIDVALQESTRLVVVKCGGDLDSKYLPLTSQEIRNGLQPMSSVTGQAFRALSIFTAYSERDEPFLDYVPAEGGKIFWVNPIVPIADEEMYAELKLESPASVEYHRLQPRVVELLQRRQSTRHLLVREPGSFNKFFASLQDRFQSRQHSRRVYHKDLTVLRGGPYRFLDYFDIEDAEFFFGRERETEELLDLIRNHPLVLLFGRSGIGKTSLIKAGVMARLEGRDEEHLDDVEVWLPVYACCEDDPVASVRQAAVQAAEAAGYDPGDAEQYESLRELLSHVAATTGKRLVVFLDQAEELFVKLGQRVRENFVTEVKDCLQDDSPDLRLVLSIREDYVGELYELREDLPDIMQHVYRLRKLDREQAEKAIAQPAINFGIQVERKLVDQLVEDLAREGVEPAHLQIVCHRLYEDMSPGSEVITQRSYEKLGGAATIVGEYLDYALGQLPLLERRIARAILKQMVVSSELKATRPLERIAQEVGQDRRVVERVLTKLVDYRLLRGVSKDKQRNYELVHERLAEQVDDWMSEEELKLKDVQDLLTRELNNFAKFQMLMGSEALHIIGDHREELKVSPQEIELVIRSAAARDIDVEYWFSRADELDTRKYQVLASLLTDDSPEVRGLAYRCVDAYVNTKLIPALVAGLEDDLPEIRQMASKYLLPMKRQLNSWLRHGNREQQHVAAKGLGQIGDQRSAPTLIEALVDENEQLTEDITEDLKKLEDRRNVSALIGRLTSEPAAPWAAAYALGQLSSSDGAVTQLRQAMRSHQDSAQLLYALGLARITRHEFDQARENLEHAHRLAASQTAQQHIQRALETIQISRRKAASGTEEWPMFGGGPQHLAYVERPLRPPLEQIWSVRTDAPIVASPVVANGLVYIGSRDTTFYALDSRQGSIRWTYNAGDRIEASAAIAGDLVVFGAVDGRMHALERSLGQEQWQLPLGGPIRASCTVQGELLFVCDETGNLWAIDWHSGEARWQVATEGETLSAPAATPELVIVGSSNDSLYARRSKDGELQWQLGTEGPVVASPTIAEGRVFCGSDDFSIYAVDLASGEIHWQTELGGMIRSTPAIAGKRLVVGCTDGNVYCLDASSGQQLWRTATGEEVLASGLITGDLVYIGSKDGILYAMDLADGQIKWEYRTVYGIYSTPAVAEATLYIGIAYYHVAAFAEKR